MQVAITPQYNETNEGFISFSKDLFIKQGSGYYKVRIDDILYIESDNIYIYIYTAIKKYMVRNTINQYLDILNSAQFFKVHRSFAININHVQAIEVNHVMINNQHIPIGKTFRNDLLSNLRLG
jgi:two-component system, LytTR family, response regulator LytT